MLSPSWLLICLIAAPDGIYLICHFLLGLVTGASVWSSKTQVKINRQKFQSVSNLTISADLHGIPAPKEFLNW